MTDDTEVLEFALNSERYCVSIGYVAEVVSRSVDEITPVPNSAPHTEGVIDLRGETTTLVDPKHLFGLDGQHSDGDGDPGGSRRIIVFDAEQRDTDGTRGWIVDEVYRVDYIDSADVDATADGESVEGIVNREDGFLIWTSPEVATT